MKGSKTTGLGVITIEPDVIAKYAGITAIEDFGIVGMASVNMKEGIVNLLKRDNVSKGVTVSVEDNHITIEFHIIVAYGVSIAAVTENLISNVRYKVEQFTGMRVDNICVYVEGVKNLD